MRFSLKNATLCECEKGQNCRIYSGPYFLILELNTHIYRVDLRSQSAYKKCRPEKTLYHEFIKDIKETHKTLSHIRYSKTKKTSSALLENMFCHIFSCYNK